MYLDKAKKKIHSTIVLIFSVLSISFICKVTSTAGIIGLICSLIVCNSDNTINEQCPT